MIRTHPPLTVPERGEFIWATGIEDTFVSAPHRVTGRRLDEYELAEHYDRWDGDLGLAAELGVSAIRYGIPWYRISPTAGAMEWEWVDRAIERIVNTHKMEPIIDLVHYGTPAWLEGAFLNPDYPQRVAEFAHAFAERYKGVCYWYTPLNEPRVTAWYTGRLGWWPPYARSWKGFAQILAQLCRGICLTQRAIQEVEPKATFVHVDATDLYTASDPWDAGVVAERDLRQELVFLALDLVQGRVGRSHPLLTWLAEHGITDEELLWFTRNSVTPHIIGYNMYPMFSLKRVSRTAQNGLQVKIVKCWTETLAELTRLYATRYAPIPVMVTETACNGSMPRRIRWIDESTEVIRQARLDGHHVVGYTFWPLFSLVGWAYQRGNRPLTDYLIDMGLWDLCAGPNGLERVATPVVDAYTRVVRAPI